MNCLGWDLDRWEMSCMNFPQAIPPAGIVQKPFQIMNISYCKQTEVLSCLTVLLICVQRTKSTHSGDVLILFQSLLLEILADEATHLQPNMKLKQAEVILFPHSYQKCLFVFFSIYCFNLEVDRDTSFPWEMQIDKSFPWEM